LAATFLFIALTSQKQNLQPAAPILKTSSPGSKAKADNNKKNSVMKRFISCVEMRRYLY